MSHIFISDVASQSSMSGNIRSTAFLLTSNTNLKPALVDHEKQPSGESSLRI